MTTFSSCCACCGAVASPPLRCGACKWLVYCSRTCQRRHWASGTHRALCATLRRVATFHAAERRFWATRSPAQLAQFAQDHDGLTPASMCFYGELLFVVLGLKPCLFVSNLPTAWRAAFTRDVVLTSEILASRSLALCVVTANVATPAEYALRDTLVLVNRSHPCCTKIDTTLHLVAVGDDGALPPSEPRDHGTQVVQEMELAWLLDYPIALDECFEPMIEVGYFAEAEDGSRQLLMSYCASAVVAHAARIRTHFARYQQQFQTAVGGKLVMHSTPLL